MSDHIAKELASREIAKALSKLSIDELRKLAAKYDVDISGALDGEYFQKADLVDDDESLVALAKRIGNHTLIDQAQKIEALAKRIDDLKGQLSYDPTPANNLRKLIESNAAEVAALNKRRADAAKLVDDYRMNGRSTPEAHAAAELALFRKRDAL